MKIPPYKLPSLAYMMDKAVAADAADKDAGFRDRPRGLGVSASRLGKPCARQTWLGLRWASPSPEFSGRLHRIFRFGHDEEARVIEDLRAAGLVVDDVDPETGAQYRIELADGWIRGYVDGIVRSGVPEAPKATHVLEVKTMKPKDWEALQRQGVRKQFPEHYHQLHIYMAGLKIDRGLYIAVNRGTLERYVERIRLDHDEAIRQVRRVVDMLADQIGPTAYTSPSSAWPCNWCEHKAPCRLGAAPARTCRTCRSFEFTVHGNGRCGLTGNELTPAAQRAACNQYALIEGLAPRASTLRIDVDATVRDVPF